MRQIYKISLVLVLWLYGIPGSGQAPERKKLLMRPVHFKFVPYDQSRVKLTEGEFRLYQLIMKFREENNLKPIPLSIALSYIAKTHSGDLTDNYNKPAGCNMHSWSAKGHWQPCCYSEDNNKAACMWDKPAELTSYKSDGFELVYYTTGIPIPETVLVKWKNNRAYTDMLLNRDPWLKDWKAIGIGIYGGYVTVWLGKATDNDGEPGLPDSETREKPK
jgi:hypothetical protein